MRYRPVHNRLERVVINLNPMVKLGPKQRGVAVATDNFVSESLGPEKFAGFCGLPKIASAAEPCFFLLSV